MVQRTVVAGNGLSRRLLRWCGVAPVEAERSEWLIVSCTHANILEFPKCEFGAVGRTCDVAGSLV